MCQYFPWIHSLERDPNIKWNLLFPLPEKWLNTEFFLVRIFLYSVQIQENTDQRKLRIWTVFIQRWVIWSTNKVFWNKSLLHKIYFKDFKWKSLYKIHATLGIYLVNSIFLQFKFKFQLRISLTNVCKSAVSCRFISIY